MIILGFGSIIVGWAGADQCASAQTTEDMLIYARASTQGVEIVLQDMSSGTSRVVYASALPGGIPDDLGYLPSLDGQWLVVWDCSPRRQSPPVTRWLLVHTPDATVRELGEMDGFPELLPYWRDDQHVVLEGHGGPVMFYVNAKAYKWPFRQNPGPKAYEEFRARLAGFGKRYYSADRTVLFHALKALGRELGLAEYLNRNSSEPREYLFLRSIGIPGQRQLRDPIMSPRFAKMAISPDRKLVARAYAREPERVSVPRGDSKSVEISLLGSRLDVFRIRSRELLWSTKTRPRPRRFPKGGPRVFPSMLPWVEPSFSHMRWSANGRYFTFTTDDIPAPSITVMDALTWTEIIHIESAGNAFAVSSPARLIPGTHDLIIDRER